ncbi:MAG: thiamine-monophosphate kinase [Paraglaciecola sp.]
MKEFSIIDDFFKNKGHQRKDVLIGIGDDCAITQVPDGQSLATTTDTLISGVHFSPETSAHAIAQKAVAVNLSDLAAMGAEPAWLNLSLSLPEIDEEWLAEFSRGLKEITDYYSIALIGGDTVQGPLVITITAQGFVPLDQALTRSKAMPGDFVYVTGFLGDAGLGLAIEQKQTTLSNSAHVEYLLNRLHYPSPRMLAGASLRRIATSCIDLSDGLISDLQHVLNASKCGACINIDKLPMSPAMLGSVEVERAINYALCSGDDYELLFTVSEEHKGKLDIALANSNVAVTCIGQCNGVSGKLQFHSDNQPYVFNGKGYEHF